MMTCTGLFGQGLSLRAAPSTGTAVSAASGRRMRAPPSLVSGAGRRPTSYVGSCARQWVSVNEGGGTDPVEHPPARDGSRGFGRSEEHTSELQSLMRISYAVSCLKTTITSESISSAEALTTLHSSVTYSLLPVSPTSS